MTTTMEPTTLDEPPAVPDMPPPGKPTHDDLTPALRLMVDELDDVYGGADCPSIDKTAERMREETGNKSWDSRGQVDKARAAYRARHGIETPPKKPRTEPAKTGRTKPTPPRRTAVVRTKPAPVVQVEPAPVVQEPVPPSPPAVVQPDVPTPAEPIEATPVPQPAETVRTGLVRRPAVWPVMLLAAPAFVAIWGGWVGLGKLTGFGTVNLLPGIVADGGWATIDSAITLPIGVETYGAYALYVWLSGRVSGRTLAFARTSAITSLLVGALGQVAYHLLVAAGVKSAPWWITTLVACLPVAVLGMGAALAHMVREEK
ncbi:ABC transporter permease [Micromonospora sp. WMMA2032]|uniref:ABC transporter permease n=1 Tax=Micromonospora sp. WMMA2032 TaxID=2039870 RepID=UPI0020A5EA82|nr:ABC transporter permease [Micromonospora sp. WMMA2032]